uniref:Uncharacterized protein n=1 Tax=Siphoviridae sp. ctt8434 TaxID=2825703 RepID=A0A8S5U1K3_9CAUD|nr:MAG TPA: hypothetical protein [Siphoviridae sp. ctt8434]
MDLKEEVLELEKEVKEIQKESFATQILQDYKKQNKRQFIVILVILGMWFATIGYLVYVLNDIGTETTEVTQENSDGNNNFIGNDGDITNGEAKN